MDISSPEFGLAHIVKAPGFCQRERVDTKVTQAEFDGTVRKTTSSFPSLFIRPKFCLHFEMFLGGRLIMLRGIFSREVTISDSDQGYVRGHHVWIVFNSKASRSVAIDVNPLPCREIWVRPTFYEWERTLSVSDKNGKITGSLSEMMDRLVWCVNSIHDDKSLDQYSKEASRLRCLFASAILNGAKSIPDVDLPMTSGTWNRSMIQQCWSRAKMLVDPFTAYSEIPSWTGRAIS